MATFVVVDSRRVTRFHLNDFVAVRIKQNNKTFNSASDVLEKYPLIVNRITDYILDLFEEGQFVNTYQLLKSFDLAVKELGIDLNNLNSFNELLITNADVNKLV